MISETVPFAAKDSYIRGHVERVSNMAAKIGQKMGLSVKGIESLRFGGILHDIGKVAVHRDILNKPGTLGSDEMKVMKRHPDVGYLLCQPFEKTLDLSLEAVRHHHEKLDGSGYPDGLKGEDISMEARIMAVVDIYDALITDRPYRTGIPEEKALIILCQEAREGKLDKEVVNCLMEVLGYPLDSSDHNSYNKSRRRMNVSITR